MERFLWILLIFSFFFQTFHPLEMRLIMNLKSNLLALAFMMPSFALSSPIQALTPLATPILQADAASITLTPGSAGSLAGRQFELYPLFRVSVDAGQTSYRYDFVDSTKNALQTFIGAKLETSPATITALQAQDYLAEFSTTEGLEPDTGAFRTLIQELRDQLKTSHVSPIQITVDSVEEDGQYTIDNLTKGYYLIDEVVASDAPSSQNKATSLCLVSTIDDNKTLQLKGTYPTLEKKIQEDDGNLANEGWNDIGDYEIGQTIPYRYTTTIPPIGAYSTYQLIFHDKMDSALDLDKNSIQVQVFGASKTYSLQANEFTLHTLSTPDPHTGETFSVEISDIKAILDREFNSAQSTYGQQIVVSYTAQLNEKAMMATGRPGFENQVRLEYSNNPDSDGTGQTGFTPWDCVVCFTFKIDGQKVSEKTDESGNPLLLSNAHFRLYRDEACQNELKVKANEEGYVVDPSGEGIDIVSDAQGTFTIYGLDQGTYYLLETQAPEGYHKPLSCIVLTITPTYLSDRDNYIEKQGEGSTILKSLSASYAYKEYYDGTTHDVRVDNGIGDPNTGSVNVSIINRSGKELPLTGGNSALISMGAGTVIVGAGLLGTFKKKKSS